MFRVILAALILSYTPSLALSVAGCQDNEFKCDNGECIGLDLKCNGKVDCNDKSDEAFVTCYDNTCRDDQFRCNYGGCIDRDLKCNSTAAYCHDGTHVSKYDCGEDEEIEKAFTELRGSCSKDHALKCGNICLRWSQVCDGIVDCQGSDEDERLELCASSLCPDKSFRCMTGGCIASDSLCNHELDCHDGSDELFEICNPTPEVTPEKETTNVMYDKPKPKPKPKPIVWRTSSCKLNLKNGTRVENYFLEYTYKNGGLVADNSVVEIKCDRGYINNGLRINKCKNGEWTNRYFNCTRQCNQMPDIRKIHYNTQCSRSHNLDDCEHNMQLYETKVNVACAAGYETNDPNGLHKCNEYGNWTTLVPSPTCKAICGLKSRHHAHSTPWTVSIFKRYSNYMASYEFVCLGTIVSPYVVLTAEECFRDHADKGRDKHLYYAVVEGEHTVGYEKDEDHGYFLHNPKAIHSITGQVGSLTHIAALTLVKPFKFGARVRPICMDAEDTIKSETYYYNVNYKLGKGVAFEHNGKYSLTHIVAGDGVKYNINTFSEGIKNYILASEKSP